MINEGEWCRFFSAVTRKGGNRKNIRMRLRPTLTIKNTFSKKNNLAFVKVLGGEELVSYISSLPKKQADAVLYEQTSKQIWRVDTNRFTESVRDSVFYPQMGNKLYINGVADERWKNDDFRYILTNASTVNVQEECNEISGMTNRETHGLGDCNIIAPAWHLEHEDLISPGDEFYIEDNRVYMYSSPTDKTGELSLIKIKFDNADTRYLYEFYDFISADDRLTDNNIYASLQEENSNRRAGVCLSRYQHIAKNGILSKMFAFNTTGVEFKTQSVVVEFDKHDTKYYKNIFAGD